MNAIEIKDLSMSFGSKQVLRGISATIQTGEIVGLIGLNGAGKSTLIKLMLGLLTPQRGQIKILGETVNEKSHLDKIGVMFQQAQAVTHLSVSEQLNWLRSFYQHPAVLSDLLAAADLTDIAKQKSTSLSGGQLRCLSFAQALSGQPDLLFLDEPTVGMDVISRQKFWHQINQLKKAGKTIILTSHYLNEIEQVADRLLILKNGNFIHDGSFEGLQARFHQQVISFQSALDPVVFSHLQAADTISHEGPHIQIKSPDSDALLKELLSAYSEDVFDIRVQRDSLDDLFAQLMTEKEGTTR